MIPARKFVCSVLQEETVFANINLPRSRVHVLHVRFRNLKESMPTSRAPLALPRFLGKPLDHLTSFVFLSCF